MNEPTVLQWLEFHRRCELGRRRVKLAAELLISDARGPRRMWKRRLAYWRLYVPLTDRPWIQWDAAPGQRLSLG